MNKTRLDVNRDIRYVTNIFFLSHYTNIFKKSEIDCIKQSEKKKDLRIFESNICVQLFDQRISRICLYL